MTEILAVVEEILAAVKEGEAAEIISIVKDLPFDQIIDAIKSAIEFIAGLVG